MTGRCLGDQGGHHADGEHKSSAVEKDTCRVRIGGAARLLDRLSLLMPSGPPPWSPTG
jgi:hypothetical protein